MSPLALVERLRACAKMLRETADDMTEVTDPRQLLEEAELLKHAEELRGAAGMMDSWIEVILDELD